jgi:hypothetical protein
MLDETVLGILIHVVSKIHNWLLFSLVCQVDEDIGSLTLVASLKEGKVVYLI